jgi:hypothetical protein
MKNPDTPQKQPQDKRNSQNQNTGPKNNNLNTNPYDSENLDRESDSGSKDITEKDIEKDLMENDPSKGFETDIDKPESSGDEIASFETIEPDGDNPVNREFEIGKLSSEDLQEDEQARDERTDGSVHFNKPSERKY